MLFIEVSNGGLPVGHPVTRKNLSYVFPAEEINAQNMLRHGYHQIIDIPPEINDSQRLEKLGFSKKEDGSYSVDYEVVDLTRKNALDELIRYRRAELLLWCDWTQATDSPLTEEKKSEWAAYRAQLRDMTDTFSEATNHSEIIWPEPPAK
jgi:hypothetical protein